MKSIRIENAPSPWKQYAQREIDSDELCSHYGRHLMAMTAEHLHDKSDIAAELAWRDAELARLTVTLQWYATATSGAIWIDCGKRAREVLGAGVPTTAGDAGATAEKP